MKTSAISFLTHNGHLSGGEGGWHRGFVRGVYVLGVSVLITVYKCNRLCLNSHGVILRGHFAHLTIDCDWSNTRKIRLDCYLSILTLY